MTTRSIYKGSALVITLFFILMLGLESLMISLFLTRSMGANASLGGQNTTARQAAQLVINDLKDALYTDASQNISDDTLYARYKRGGSITTYSNASTSRYDTVDPEDGGYDMLDTSTSAWVQENRGSYFHLVGRAVSGSSDIIVHRWIDINPCSSPGILSTILTGANYPGYRSTGVDPVTGRVFFGTAKDDDYTGTNLYTWHPDTGLSTIVSNKIGVGNRSMFVASDGRAFFGEGSDSSTNNAFWTWKNGVLSTLVTGVGGAGRGNNTSGKPYSYFTTFKLSLLDERNDRIYFGAHSTRALYTWKNNILSTITAAGAYGDPIGRLALGATDEVFYEDYTGSHQLFRWVPSTTPQTQLAYTYPGAVSGGLGGFPWSIYAQPNGKVWTTYGYTNPIYTWTTPSTLASINKTFDYTLSDDTTYSVNSNNNLFFTDNNGVYAWSSASPTTVTTLVATKVWDTANSGSLVAFSSTSAGAYLWSPSNGLSTLINTAAGGIELDASRNIVFYSNYSGAANVYAWNYVQKVLSTILPATQNYPGYYPSTQVDNTGRLYFSNYASSSARLWAYKPEQGLVTIMTTGSNFPGTNSIAAHPVEGVYFGENSASGNFYYATVRDCTMRGY